jgi:hypothetical protein
MPVEIMVFKAGSYPQGEWPKERVQKLVDSYDPVKSWEAPGVIGHLGRWDAAQNGDEGEFAHTWVQSLRVDGAGKIFAAFSEFSHDLKMAIMEKKLKYCSIEVLENDKIDPNQPPYLARVAFLGRSLPAIPTTLIPAQFSMAFGSITAFQDKEKNSTTFFRKLDINEFDFNSASADENKKEEEIPMTPEERIEIDDLKKDNAEMKAALNKANERIEEFSKDGEAAKTIDAKKESEVFFSNLRDEGKLPPAVFQKTVDFDLTLNPDQKKAFRETISSFEKIVDTNGGHFANKEKAGEQIEGNLVEKITTYQTENEISSFEHAARICKQKYPDWFEGE